MKTQNILGLEQPITQLENKKVRKNWHNFLKKWEI